MTPLFFTSAAGISSGIHNPLGGEAAAQLQYGAGSTPLASGPQPGMSTCEESDPMSTSLSLTSQASCSTPTGEKTKKRKINGEATPSEKAEKSQKIASPAFSALSGSHSADSVPSIAMPLCSASELQVSSSSSCSSSHSKVKGLMNCLWMAGENVFQFLDHPDLANTLSVDRQISNLRSLKAYYFRRNHFLFTKISLITKQARETANKINNMTMNHLTRRYMITMWKMKLETQAIVSDLVQSQPSRSPFFHDNLILSELLSIIPKKELKAFLKAIQPKSQFSDQTECVSELNKYIRLQASVNDAEGLRATLSFVMDNPKFAGSSSRLLLVKELLKLNDLETARLAAIGLRYRHWRKEAKKMLHQKVKMVVEKPTTSQSSATTTNGQEQRVMNVNINGQQQTCLTLPSSSFIIDPLNSGSDSLVKKLAPYLYLIFQIQLKCKNDLDARIEALAMRNNASLSTQQHSLKFIENFLSKYRGGKFQLTQQDCDMVSWLFPNSGQATETNSQQGIGLTSSSIAAHVQSSVGQKVHFLKEDQINPLDYRDTWFKIFNNYSEFYEAHPTILKINEYVRCLLVSESLYQQMSFHPELMNRIETKPANLVASVANRLAKTNPALAEIIFTKKMQQLANHDNSKVALLELLEMLWVATQWITPINWRTYPLLAYM